MIHTFYDLLCFSFLEAMNPICSHVSIQIKVRNAKIKKERVAESWGLLLHKL